MNTLVSLLVGKRKLRVEGNNGYIIPSKDPEIMQSRFGIHGAELLEHSGPEKMGLMIFRVHGIHMNDAHDAEFPVKFRLQAVNDVMGMHQSEVRGDLRVKGYNLMPRPVIVDHEVVHIEDSLRVKDYLLDLGGERRVRSLSKKGTYGVKGGADPCVKDEERDGKSAPSVQVKSEIR